MAAQLKAMANTREAATLRPAADAPIVLKETPAKNPENEVNVQDKNIAVTLSSEIQKLAKDIAKPILLAQQGKRAEKDEVELEVYRDTRFTKISDGLGNIEILKARIIAEELPKEEGRGASGEEIDQLRTPTTLPDNAKDRARMSFKTLELG